MAEPNIALYTLGTQYLALLDTLSGSDFDAQTIADTIESTGIEDDIQHKIEGYEMVARNLEAYVPSIDHEIARLQALKAHRKGVAEQLRGRVLRFMLDTGIERVTAPRFTISIRANPEKVVIFNEAQLPAEYWREPPVPDSMPDKTLIKAALKAGQDVPGAKLERTQRLDVK